MTAKRCPHGVLYRAGTVCWTCVARRAFPDTPPPRDTSGGWPRDADRSLCSRCGGDDAGCYICGLRDTGDPSHGVPAELLRTVAMSHGMRRAGVPRATERAAFERLTQAVAKRRECR